MAYNTKYVNLKKIKSMKRKLFIFNIILALAFTVSLSVFQTACEAESSCENSDTIDGIIDTVYDLGNCYQYMRDTSYVISDIVEFKKLKNEIDSAFYAQNSQCDTAQLIVPDFTKYSLLAYFTEVKACDAAYKRTVLNESALHKYIYTIEIEACGNCTYMIPNMNWVLVPKLPENYTVEYKVLRK